MCLLFVNTGVNMFYNPLLERFIIVAECNSFRKAADILYLSPAAVKKDMDTLEQQFGIQLFIRSKTGITLTAEGNEILDYSRFLIKESQEKLLKIREKYDSYTIKIANTFYIHNDTVYKYINKYLQSKHKFIVFPYTAGRETLSSLISSLKNNKIDCFTFIECNSKFLDDIVFTPITDINVELLVPIHHTLANRKLLHFQDLENLTFSTVMNNIVPMYAKIQDDIKKHSQKQILSAVLFRRLPKIQTN